MTMNTRLMQLLNFTAVDLSYNRGGTLSPEQQARLTAKRRRLKGVLFSVGLLLAGVGGGVFGRQAYALYTANDPNWIGDLIGAGVLGLLGLPLVYLGLKRMRPITVGAVQGPARIARVQRSRSTHDPNTGTSSSSNHVATEMHIQGKIFTLPDAAFSELEDGAVYAVYYWEGLNELFALEKL